MPQFGYNIKKTITWEQKEYIFYFCSSTLWH